MPLYEHVFLTRQDVSSQQVETLTEQYKTIIEDAGGTVAKVENWGLKTLAYRIRKNRKAYYTLMNFDTGPEALAEVERQQRLSEDVLRSLTIKVDELEEGPSAMMQKRDDRDRGPRGRDRDRGPRRDGPRDGPRGDRDGPRGDRPERSAPRAEDGE